VLQDCILDEWLDGMARLHGTPGQRDERHRAILKMIPADSLYCSLTVEDTLVASGLGVREGDFFGLFNIFTAQAARGRGYGRALVSGMLHRANVMGAQVAYLQVMENNTPARGLYRQLGFVDVYPYWYRMKLD
jgi:ribosomal protein S18 acetylase RimI-like enzyme